MPSYDVAVDVADAILRRHGKGRTTIHLAKRVFKREEEDSLRRAFRPLGWVETSSAASADVVWDVWLSDAETDRHAAIAPGQVLNRFPAMADCCRKAVFATIFSRLRRLLPATAPLNDGRFVPAQFSLPRQREALSEHVQAAASAARARNHQQPFYIVKPDVGSRGDGIRLTAEPERKSGAAGQERVVQEYIGRPMTLDGLKFDLRLYVLLTDVQESAEDGGLMRLFLYREGLARFAVEAYQAPSGDNARNVHMHLTNYSLNRRAEGFKHCDDADGGDGSKRTVTSVFERLQRTGRVDDADDLWMAIEALVARSVGVIYPILQGARSRWSNSCFQILGLDVLLDADGQPWLMEINDHPSVRIDSSRGGSSVPSAVDEGVKVPMLRDALRILSALHGLNTNSEGGRGSSDSDGESHSSEAVGPTAPPAPPKLAGAPPGGGRAAGLFREIVLDRAEMSHLQLLSRLRDLFELHTPSSALFEATWGDARREDAFATSSAGPRWRAATFAKFLQSAGLVNGHRAAAVAAGLSRPDAELVFASVCGKGGTMDLLDFVEALARIAARLYPDMCGPNGERAAPTELLERLLARCFTDGHGGTTAPASSRAATAARAAAVGRAAAAAAVRGLRPLMP